MTINKKTLIRWKVYFDRARIYISYIQVLMIGAIFAKSFESSFVTEYAYIVIPASIVLFVVLSLVIGYWDCRLGIREEEFDAISRSNPVLMETLRQVKEINNKLKV